MQAFLSATIPTYLHTPSFPEALIVDPNVLQLHLISLFGNIQQDTFSTTRVENNVKILGAYR